MQLDENNALYTNTRYDGIKTAAFVAFCLLLSLLLLAATVALWLVS
jgi:hypothetical protein